ncbi:MAG: ATP-binding protein [Actinobacteria bacterium]|nr:ATP-binding protein [Actinomycetota bacterium]
MARAMFAAGLPVPRHRATTAQLCAAYPFQAEGGLGVRGAYQGELVSGGGGFYFDPFQAYTDGLVDNPNMLVAGLPRVGKSATVKAFLARWVGALRSPGGLRRWAAIVDPKGEYEALGSFLGLDVVRLHPGGTSRLNPLDPGPAGRGSRHGAQSDEQVRIARTTMVAALLASVLDRPLGPLEDAALGWAVEALGARTPNSEPTLADLAALLAQPTATMAERAGRSPAALAAAVDDVRLGLGKLLDRELRGMFDGPSTVRVDWSGRGLVLDLSSVRHNHAALALVMIATTGWLQSALAVPEGGETPRRYQVVDEAWALLGDVRTAQYLQGCWKLCGAYGVANIAVTHRLSDLRSQADDGTTTAKVAMGLLADTDTRVLLRQSSDQVPDAVGLLGLSPAEAYVVQTLEKGQALWKVRDHPVVVQQVISEREWAFCGTDGLLVV